MISIGIQPPLQDFVNWKKLLRKFTLNIQTRANSNE